MTAPSARDLHTETWALWLLPAETDREPLEHTIRDLAAELGGPVFPPHVTLLSGLERGAGTPPHSLQPALETGARALASTLAPIPLAAHGWCLGGEPFQALFLPMPVTQALWQARRAACKAFPGRREPESFLPHLSLYYGFAPLARRAALIEELRHLRSWKSEAASLHLVEAFGPPGRWRIAGTFPLGAG